MSETSLVHDFIAQASVAIPEVRLFRRNIMAAKTASGSFVRAGIKGQADVYGFWSGVRPTAAIEIEAKALRGSLSEEQERWAAFCRGRGIIYLQLRVARGESNTETVNRWIRELQAALR